MLRTEMRNSRTIHMDKMETQDVLRLINDENRTVADAVEGALPAITAACDAMVEVLSGGGRVFYIGAGTSGRLGLCDAAECPPTFGVSPEMFVGILAGGISSMVRASESVEDDPKAGVADLQANNFCEKDMVVGVSASGSAAYVIAAIEYANGLGAHSVSITNNPDTALEHVAQIGICADTGPEALTGSTRMKAGTAQKMILNMLSTAAMVKCGYVYENMMINLRPTNQKLRRRMIGIVTEIAGCSSEQAEQLLEQADWSIRRAVEK